MLITHAIPFFLIKKCLSDDMSEFYFVLIYLKVQKNILYFQSFQNSELKLVEKLVDIMKN